MAERPQFLLFGSSIVQHNFYDNGWGAMLRAFYARKANIVERGYAGWNSRRGLQIVHKIVPKDVTEQPALMIVNFGGEDSTRPYHGLGPHVPLEEYIQNMRNIALHILRTSPKTRLIFLSTPPINEEQIPHNIDPEGNLKRTNEACQRYSEALLDWCRKFNQFYPDHAIRAIDLWSAIQTVDNWKDVCFIDGVNFTAKGSSIVVDEILKVLKESSWEPSLYWVSMPDEFGEDSPFDRIAPDGRSTMNVSHNPFPDGLDWEKHKVLKESSWEPSLHWESMPDEFGEESPFDEVRRQKRSTIDIPNNPFPDGLDWEKYKVLQAQNSKKP